MDFELWTGGGEPFDKETECFYESKSEEEINRYTLKEDLTSLQRAKEILTYGDLVQKIAIYKILPSLVQEQQVEEKLLLMIAKQLESQDALIQVEAGHSFLKMIADKKAETFKSSESLRDIFYLTVNMLHLESVSVIDAWVDVLKQLLEEIPFNEIQKDLTAEIYDLSGVCSHPASKYAAMKIIAVALQYWGNKIGDNLLELIKLFGQVNDLEIKKSVISQIWPKLFPLLRTSSLDADWLPITIQMIKDEKNPKEIRSLAITTLAQTVQFFSSEAKAEKIVPVLSYFMTLEPEKGQAPAISKQFGLFFFHMEKEIALKGVTVNVLNYILGCIEHPDEEVRLNTAYNFPCFFSLFLSKHKDKIMKAFLQLMMKDKSTKVRVQIIKGLYEMIKLVKEDDIKNLLRQPLKALLGEKEPNEIRVEFAKKCPSLLELFKRMKSPFLALFSEDLLNEIVNCIESNVKSPCWRFVKQLLEVFESQSNVIYGGDEFQERYASVLLKCLTDSNFEVKKLAAKNLVMLLGWQNSPDKRENIFSQINSKLFAGRSYQLRLAYLEIVDECILKFPRSFFKTHNLLQAMQYASDSVPNVRRKLAELIVKIRNSIFKEDLCDIELFDSLVIHLVSDRDSETAKIAQELHQNLRDIDSFLTVEDAAEANRILDLPDLDSAQKLTEQRSLDYIEKNYANSCLISSSGFNSVKRNIKVSKLPSSSAIKTTSNPTTNNHKSLSAPKNTSLAAVSKPTTLNSSQSPLVKPFVLVPPQKPRRDSSFNSLDKASKLQQQTVYSSPFGNAGIFKNPNILPPISQLSQSFQTSLKILAPFELNILPNDLNESTQITQQNLPCNTATSSIPSLNKSSTLKPIQSFKLPLKKPILVNSNSLNEKIDRTNTTNSVLLTSQFDKKMGIAERKATFENNPNVITSPNLYRIKKPSGLVTWQQLQSTLPPKIPIKKKL